MGSKSSIVEWYLFDQYGFETKFILTIKFKMNIFLTLAEYYIICVHPGWALKDVHKFVYVSYNIYKYLTYEIVSKIMLLLHSHILKLLWSYIFYSSYAEIRWNSEFENLVVDSTYKWKDTATCLNLILDHYHDGVLGKSFYTAISGVPSFKVTFN